jgi:hypothetical protein
MISMVTIQNFKRFKAQTTFVLQPGSVTSLAGSSSSTLEHYDGVPGTPLSVVQQSVRLQRTKICR